MEKKVAQIFKSWQSRGSNWGPSGQKAEILPTAPTTPAHKPLRQVVIYQSAISFFNAIRFELAKSNSYLMTSNTLDNPSMLPLLNLHCRTSSIIRTQWCYLTTVVIWATAYEIRRNYIIKKPFIDVNNLRALHTLLIHSVRFADFVIFLTTVNKIRQCTAKHAFRIFEINFYQQIIIVY